MASLCPPDLPGWSEREPWLGSTMGLPGEGWLTWKEISPQGGRWWLMQEGGSGCAFLGPPNLGYKLLLGALCPGDREHGSGAC